MDEKGIDRGYLIQNGQFIRLPLQHGQITIEASNTLIQLWFMTNDRCDFRLCVPEGRSVSSGLLGSMLGFVPALGPAIGASVAHVFGWQGIFALLALLGALAGAQAFLCWPETRPTAHAVAKLAHVREILTNGPFLIYTLGLP